MTCACRIPRRCACPDRSPATRVVDVDRGTVLLVAPLHTAATVARTLTRRGRAIHLEGWAAAESRRATR